MSLPKIHCQAVRVPALPADRIPVNFTPEDLVPGADPYIAALLQRLETELRTESDAGESGTSRSRLPTNRISAPRAEVPPPLPGEGIEFQSPGDGPWFWWEGR